MNISNIGSIARQQFVSKTAGISTTKSVNLSQEELSMIKEKFPASESGKLELYQPTGGSIIENPNSRGNNLDFRV